MRRPSLRLPAQKTAVFMAREPSARHIADVSNAISLTTARSLAPAAFRRWVLGAISLVIFGYLLVTLLWRAKVLLPRRRRRLAAARAARKA